MTTALPLTAPTYVESYLVLHAPLDAIHGYMALKADEDDLGPRLYCEFQSAVTGRRALLFSYQRGDALEEWTYLLTDGAFSIEDVAAMLGELRVDPNLVDSARSADGEPMIDLAALRRAAAKTAPSLPISDGSVPSPRLRASQAIFDVAPDATRAEIKAAAEALLGTKVRSVDLVASETPATNIPLPRRAIVSFQPPSPRPVSDKRMTST